MATSLLDELLGGGGASFGNPNIRRQGAKARALAAQRDVNTLPDPRTYAAVSGLLGTAPDEMGFSVLNPQYQAIQQVAQPAFALGTALGVAPAAGLIGKLGAKTLGPTAADMTERYMQRQGLMPGIIDHPFLKPSVALSSNPYAGLSGPDRSNMTRYLAKMKNPNFVNRELMREQGSTVSQTTSTGGLNLVTPEDWYRAGNPLVATGGDTSLAGKTFSNVEGVPLSQEVNAQGGFQHTLNNLMSGSDNAWASMEGNAQGKQNHFDKVAVETGQIPRSVFFSMNPKDSADFSTPITEMVMGQLQALPPSQKAAKLADSMMRKKFPDFVGVNHPDAMSQLMGTNGYKQEGSGAMRKRFAWASKQKSLDSLGWPSYEDARNTITHPMLKNANVGDSGLSSFLANPGADLIQNSGHNSYNRGISGTDAQSLPVSIPAQNMFPDLYSASGLKTNKGGKRFTHDQKIGDIKMGHYYQMPDQKWLDQIMPVYEQEVQRALLTNGLLSQFP